MKAAAIRRYRPCGPIPSGAPVRTAHPVQRYGPCGPLRSGATTRPCSPIPSGAPVPAAPSRPALPPVLATSSSAIAPEGPIRRTVRIPARRLPHDPEEFFHFAHSVTISLPVLGDMIRRKVSKDEQLMLM
jgi:hypothetical protein